MDKITGERIDKAIDSAILKVSESFLDDFQDNINAFDKMINKDTNYKNSDYAVSDFAVFKTAMDYYVEIFRSVLKELLCE